MMKILIVDDDQEFAYELNDILMQEGYEASVAEDGPTAIEMINQSFFDVLLLDYRMPGINGIDLINYMQEKDIKSKIILISGSMNIEKLLDDEGISSAVSFVLSKPFIIEDLLEKLSRLYIISR